MAEDFGVPKEKIKVHIVHVGGDFGAKASLIDVPIAYYLSKAAGEDPLSSFSITPKSFSPAVTAIRRYFH